MSNRNTETFKVPEVVDDQIDKATLLRHGVFDAPEKGFLQISEKAPGSSRPGICWSADIVRQEAVMFKGTSQQPKRAKYLASYAIIEPSDQNGLALRTYFNVSEFVLVSTRKLELLNHNRRLGTLSQEDVATVTQALDELRRV
jgi:hypothetical protein